MSKKSKSLKPAKSLKDTGEVITSDFIRGDVLDDLLSKLVRSVETAKASRGGLPEKIWMKQQFAIGVNDVTRVLERMPVASATHPTHNSSEAQTVSSRHRAPLVPLQAVLLATDCNPKWLTKHIPTLASTRQVPALCLKDNKGSSLRLGHVVNVRTALAIGVKSAPAPSLPRSPAVCLAALASGSALSLAHQAEARPPQIRGAALPFGPPRPCSRQVTNASPTRLPSACTVQEQAMATMETMTSQSVREEVGRSSGGPPSISISATKRKKPPTVANQKRRSAAKHAKSPTVGNQQKSPTSSLKRPAETSQKKQLAAKRVKTPTMENQQKSPTSSPLKRPAEMSKQRQPPAKRFKPPMVGKKQMLPLVRRSPIVTGAPMMRLVVPPVVMGQRSPSNTVERSPSPSTSPSPYLDDQTRSTDSPDSTSAKSKPRRLRSEIWNDMDPIYHDGKVIQARCKYCNEVFTAARNSGTSHMRRHLGVCEPRIKMHDMVEKLKSSVLSTETTVLTNWKFDRTITRCELVRLIVLHELPFSFVEYDGFRSYSLSLNPLAESVSRTTIKENCMETFKNQRSSLRDLFRDCNCRFSLAADMWTSNQNTGYMVVTCHYIDGDWTVQKKLIRFCVVKTPHDGFNLYSVML